MAEELENMDLKHSLNEDEAYIPNSKSTDLIKPSKSGNLDNQQPPGECLHIKKKVKDHNFMCVNIYTNDICRLESVNWRALEGEQKKVLAFQIFAKSFHSQNAPKIIIIFHPRIALSLDTLAADNKLRWNAKWI